MRATDPSGSNNLYARSGSNEGGGGNGSGSRPAGCKDGRKIGATGLGYIGGFGDGSDLLFVEAYDQLPVQDRNGRRECPGFANGSLHLKSRAEIVRSGEAVCDDRRFQPNYWLALG